MSRIFDDLITIRKTHFASYHNRYPMMTFTQGDGGHAKLDTQFIKQKSKTLNFVERHERTFPN